MITIETKVSGNLQTLFSCEPLIFSICLRWVFTVSCEANGERRLASVQLGNYTHRLSGCAVILPYAWWRVRQVCGNVTPKKLKPVTPRQTHVRTGGIPDPWERGELTACSEWLWLKPDIWLLDWKEAWSESNEITDLLPNTMMSSSGYRKSWGRSILLLSITRMSLLMLFNKT